MSEKRIARWSENDREWFVRLTPAEQDLVRVLVAHLNAQPVDADD